MILLDGKALSEKIKEEVKVGSSSTCRRKANHT